MRFCRMGFFRSPGRSNLRGQLTGSHLDLRVAVRCKERCPTSLIRVFFPTGAIMNRILRHLFVAAAIGATSLGASAQTSTMTPSPQTSTAPSPQTSTTPPSSTVGANVKAEADYRAAVTACDAQTGAAKAACLSDAEKARDRAMGAKSGMSSGQGNSSTSGGASSSSGASTGTSGGMSTGTSGGPSGGGTSGSEGGSASGGTSDTSSGGTSGSSSGTGGGQK